MNFLFWLAMWFLAEGVFLVFWSALQHRNAERPRITRW